MSILTLDLGQNTGWCISNKKKEIVLHGWILCKPSRFEGGGMQFLKFRRFLEEKYTHMKMTERDPIKEVYFEEVRRHLGTTAAHIYGGFSGVLTSFCEEWKIPYRGIGVMVMKKYVSEDGHANKESVMAAVNKRLGTIITSDDEADAIGLMFMAIDGVA